MELEKKHVVPYLPFGLKAEILDYLSDYVGEKYDEIIGIHQWSKNKDWCLLTDKGSKPSLRRIKPILRPLSDLVNYYDEICWTLFDSRNPNNYESSKFEVDEVIKNGVQFDTYNGFVNWMYENHFDVFGLLKHNLAININTLNK